MTLRRICHPCRPAIGRPYVLRATEVKTCRTGSFLLLALLLRGLSGAPVLLLLFALLLGWRRRRRGAVRRRRSRRGLAIHSGAATRDLKLERPDVGAICSGGGRPCSALGHGAQQPALIQYRGAGPGIYRRATRGQCIGEGWPAIVLQLLQEGVDAREVGSGNGRVDGRVAWVSNQAERGLESLVRAVEIRPQPVQPVAGNDRVVERHLWVVVIGVDAAAVDVAVVVEDRRIGDRGAGTRVRGEPASACIGAIGGVGIDRRVVHREAVQGSDGNPATARVLPVCVVLGDRRVLDGRGAVQLDAAAGGVLSGGVVARDRRVLDRGGSRGMDPASPAVVPIRGVVRDGRVVDRERATEARE